MESIARGTAIPSCIDVSPSGVSYTEVAMMLRHSFSLEREAASIEHAMGEAIAVWVCQSAGQTQRSLAEE